MRACITHDVPALAISPARGVANTATREGAERLASMINAEWALLGYDAGARAEPASDNHHCITWMVRSDMIRGVPVRRLPQARQAA